MIRIIYDDKNARVLIRLKCHVYKNVNKDLEARRPYNEKIGLSFKKLYENYSNHLRINIKREKRRLEKDKNNLKKNQDLIQNLSDEIKKLTVSSESIPLSLYDSNNGLVSLETKNIDAWKENYTFKLKDQEFKVCVNLPSIKRLVLPKLLLAGMPAVLRIEHENEDLEDLIEKNSLFKWYCSEDSYPEKSHINQENIKWNLFSEGVSQKMVVIDSELENKLIKVECIPRDDKKQGLTVKTGHSNPVLRKLDQNKLLMSERHKYTDSFLDSNLIRVMSYNKLASCYTDSSEARQKGYSYCPPEFLSFQYRRVLLTSEIKDYKCDIIFLQECEKVFVDQDLESSMPGYDHKFIPKIGLNLEGEAILFRTKRFKYIKSLDIYLTKELTTDPIFKILWENISKNEKLKESIIGRGNVLQVVLVEFLEKKGNFFLLANTHFYYQPTADFIRLIQSIVSVKYLEKLKKELLNDENLDIKKLSILFGGDFNTFPNSRPYKYIKEQGISQEILQNEKDYFEQCQYELLHSLKFSTYDNFKLTNCGGEFEGILDYIFYETESFQLAKVIPLPPVEKIREFKGIPSKYVPSDHLALIFELLVK